MGLKDQLCSLRALLAWDAAAVADCGGGAKDKGADSHGCEPAVVKPDAADCSLFEVADLPPCVEKRAANPGCRGVHGGQLSVWRCAVYGCDQQRGDYADDYSMQRVLYPVGDGHCQKCAHAFVADWWRIDLRFP